MAGLTIDRALRVGDGLLINDQVVEITALSWRTVVGQRPDGGRIILPNSRLADNTIEVLPRTQPAQVEAVIKIKAAIPPHEVSEIVDQILADMDAVDLTQPEIVTAMDADITGRRAQYRITFWVRHYSQRDTAEGNFRRRAWYAFRRQSSAERADTAHSKQDEAAVARALEQALRTAKLVQGDSEVSAAAIKSLIEAGEILSYGDGERIILPARLADHLYVLVSGTLAEALPFVEVQVSSVSNAKQPISAAPTTRQGWLDRIQRSLALRIGPYAEHATRIAAGNAASIAEVCATVAMEIEDPAKREAFVSEVNAPSERIHQPGLLFRSNRDRVRRLWSDPPLRAVDHAEIIAVPSALLERHLPAGKKAARVS
jgi:hypothetical protein